MQGRSSQGRWGKQWGKHQRPSQRRPFKRRDGLDLADPGNDTGQHDERCLIARLVGLVTGGWLTLGRRRDRPDK